MKQKVKYILRETYIYRKIAGVHEENNNGKIMLDFCLMQNFLIRFSSIRIYINILEKRNVDEINLS